MLIAVSAAYGALGSVIGPRLAEALGVPFVDRAIPLAVAEQLDVPLEQADADEEPHGMSFFERVLAAFEHADPMIGPAPVTAGRTSEDFHRATEATLLRQAARGEGVILGRGAVCLLREDPRVLRVRLDGDVEARVRQAMELQGLTREAAERGRRHSDRAHADYARRFYGADIADAGLYQLVLDATALPAPTCVELIATAARALHGTGVGTT